MNETNSTLAPSAACVACVKKFEGLRLKAYQDSVGVWTIGYGHTKDVHKNDIVTEDEAENLLYEDLDESWQGVYSLVNVSITQGQCDALTSFVFNLGARRLKESTLLKKINAGDDTAPDEFKKWVYAGNTKLAGLVARRGAERELFISA